MERAVSYSRRSWNIKGISDGKVRHMEKKLLFFYFAVESGKILID